MSPQDSPPQTQGRPFAVEYYYKARWGFAEEFLALFRKNHWQVLQKQVESGRLVRVTAVKPRYHAPEEGRWDFRVTIVFRDVAAAFDASAEEGLKRHRGRPPEQRPCPSAVVTRYSFHHLLEPGAVLAEMVRVCPP